MKKIKNIVTLHRKDKYNKIFNKKSNKNEYNRRKKEILSFCKNRK